jgi:oligo-1,6-glucosidase
MGCDDIGLKWFKTRLRPKKLMKTLVKWQTGLDWNTNYFENHDQPRFVSRFADSEGFREKCSMMMAGLLMTLRGTPFVYQGQEIGMTNGDFRCLKQIQDVESHGVDAMARDALHIPAKMRWNMIRRGTRDNARTPMQWDNSLNAGFTTGKPWLRVNRNHKKINVMADRADENSVFSFWKYMISLRKTDEALIDGDFVPVRISNDIFAFERTYNDRRLLSVCNMTGREVALPAHLRWENLLAGNYDDVADRLRPFEFRLMESSVEPAETEVDKL